VSYSIFPSLVRVLLIPPPSIVSIYPSLYRVLPGFLLSLSLSLLTLLLVSISIGIIIPTALVYCVFYRIDPSLYCAVRYLFSSLYVPFLFFFVLLVVVLLPVRLLPLRIVELIFNGFERVFLFLFLFVVLFVFRFRFRFRFLFLFLSVVSKEKIRSFETVCLVKYCDVNRLSCQVCSLFVSTMKIRSECVKY
jgi:hypothetical protein